MSSTLLIYKTRMAKHAITISFNENCGVERSRFLFARIWSRACKRAYGKKRHLRPVGYGALDKSRREMTHIHILADIEHCTEWFLECLQESCQHFNPRFVSWHKVLPEDEQIGYIRYIESKRITKYNIIW